MPASETVRGVYMRVRVYEWRIQRPCLRELGSPNPARSLLRREVLSGPDAESASRGAFGWAAPKTRLEKYKFLKGNNGFAPLRAPLLAGSRWHPVCGFCLWNSKIPIPKSPPAKKVLYLFLKNTGTLKQIHMFVLLI